MYKENLRHRHRTEMSAPVAPQTTQGLETPLPTASVLLQAAKLAQQQDRPIQLDYYADSCVKKAFVGEDQETKDKLLIKSNDEFTSLISKIYRVDSDFLVLTENSIYIVSGKIEKRKVQTAALLAQE
jgi:hypothetical protein